MGWPDWKRAMGTRVVKNGNPMVSDVHFGWLLKAIFVAILGLCAAGVQRAFYISTKVDMIDERILQAQREATEARREAESLRIEMNVHAVEAARIHELYLRRDEFLSYMKELRGK